MKVIVIRTYSQIPVEFQTITVGENETDGETKVISLREGLEFPTRECASKFVKEYCNAKKVKFVITSGGSRSDSGSRQLVWSCTYGKERKPRGTRLNYYYVAALFHNLWPIAFNIF